ncbi:MAG: hypothetical protein M3Q31_03305 [Actinomycetota bacterium]|nr:hypothetical protein [Actinomycetota bacterium]
MDDFTNTVARVRLEALVGQWRIEAGPPGGGRVTSEWLDGVPLLVERSHVDVPEAPDGVAVIGCDGTSDTYTQLYTDERDVQRIYKMSLGDGVWKLWRDGEPFSQRFTGMFSANGKRIDGRWEIAEDGKTWKTDFDLTYTKVECGSYRLSSRLARARGGFESRPIRCVEEVLRRRRPNSGRRSLTRLPWQRRRSTTTACTPRDAR